MTKKQSIQELLPAYFEGTLNSEQLKKVDLWKASDRKNLLAFEEYQKVWERTELLRRMQKYDGQKALEKVNQKIEKKTSVNIVTLFQKVAAILILPLLIASIYFYTQETGPDSLSENLHTLKTGSGMRSEYVLPDGTKVYLNSNTSLTYPIAFNGQIRSVDLKGEAYFEVVENEEQPFVVNTGSINIEVTGTEFKASNYGNEELTEIVLVEGGVRLFQGNYFGEREMFKALVPGEKATYFCNDKMLYYEKVDIEKYIAWKDGKLMFRDDSMAEVVRRLNRWYNVDIKLSGNDLGNYVYTATFEDESLIQVLDLLKISAPINYKIKPRQRNEQNTFSKMEIEIIQK